AGGGGSGFWVRKDEMMRLSFLLVLGLLGAGVVCLGAEEESGEVVFMGKVLPGELRHEDAHAVRDLFVEDVPGTKSYWLGPWVEVVKVKGIGRFYVIQGYDRFYVNAAFPESSEMEFLSRSSGIYDFYGPFEGAVGDHFELLDG
ncbi:MAG: hypothetical protein AAF591_22145, partial [Verrucomicrobiota bacterium]